MQSLLDAAVFDPPSLHNVQTTLTPTQNTILFVFSFLAVIISIIVLLRQSNE